MMRTPLVAAPLVTVLVICCSLLALVEASQPPQLPQLPRSLVPSGVRRAVDVTLAARNFLRQARPGVRRATDPGPTSTTDTEPVPQRRATDGAEPTQASILNTQDVTTNALTTSIPEENIEDEDEPVGVAGPYVLGESMKDLPQLTASQKVAIDKVTKLLVVGDLHGDFQALKKMLKSAGFKLSTDDDKPIASIPADTAIAFTGDYFDRGSEDHELFNFLYAARTQHPDKFFMLMGNHESWILKGQTKDSATLSKESLTDLSLDPSTEDFKKRKNAQTCDGELNKRLRTLPGMLKLGNTLLAHGGPSWEWTTYLYKKYKDSGAKLVKRYNDLMKQDLERACQAFTELIAGRGISKHDKGGFSYDYMAGGRLATCGADSPLWFRGFSKAKTDDESYGQKCCDDAMAKGTCKYPSTKFAHPRTGCFTTTSGNCKVNNRHPLCAVAWEVMEHFGVERMVFGHQIQENGIRHLCDGHLIFIDVEISKTMRDRTMRHRTKDAEKARKEKAKKKNVPVDQVPLPDIKQVPRVQYLSLEKGQPPTRNFFDVVPSEPEPLKSSTGSLAPLASGVGEVLSCHGIAEQLSVNYCP